MSLHSYLAGGDQAEICDGIVVPLDQASLERQVAVTPPTLVKVSRPASDGEDQSFVACRRAVVLVRMEHSAKGGGREAQEDTHRQSTWRESVGEAQQLCTPT